MSDQMIPGDHKVQLGAFFAALFLAPFLVALLGFWAEVPVFALIFGLPTYLTFGAVTFFWWIRAGFYGTGDLAQAGFVAHVLSLPFVFPVCQFFLEFEAAFGIIAAFGLLMAPIWGLTFGFLYGWFRHD